jgi:pre-mRNA-processing factor SLU7
MSAQQRRQEREIEELRKQGLAMPATDESGKLINPHIPAYLSKTPWYIGSGEQPTLKHQRQDYHEQFNNVKGGIGAVRHDVKTNVVQQQQFRPGACTNCGGMGHNRSSCLERPRLHSAKYANTTYAEKDQFVTENKLTFEAKRDRYANFTTEQWLKQQELLNIEMQKQFQLLSKMDQNRGVSERIKEWQDMLDGVHKLDEKKKLKEQNETNGENKAGDKYCLIEPDYDTDEELDEISKYSTILLNDDFFPHKSGSQASSTDSISRMLSLEDRIKLNPKLGLIANQLLGNPDKSANKIKLPKGGLGIGMDASGTGMPSTRLMGDVPKYLLNLDDDAAFYDPKTHSMRENPFPIGDPRWKEYETLYNSKNYQVDEMKELELFSFEFKELTGKEINPVLNPTLVAQLKKQYDELKVQSQLNQRKLLESLYGDIFEKKSNNGQGNDPYNQHTRHNVDSEVQSDKKKQRLLVSPNDLEPTQLVSLFDPNTNTDNSTTPHTNDTDLLILPSRKKTNQIPSDVAFISNATADGDSTAATLPGEKTVIVRSKYQEDVYEGNHTQIWGSYYDINEKAWGYACCKSITRFAYCIPCKK